MNKHTPEQASAIFDELLKPAEEKTESPVVDGALADQPPEATFPKSTQTSQPVERVFLEPAARKAVVRLMRQGVLTAKKNPSVFATLCKYQLPVQAHLADMYLKMTLDIPEGIVLLQEQSEEELYAEGDEPVSLISRRTLTLYDTLLLLVLRKYFQERESSGEQQVVIDIEQLESLLTPFLPLSNSSRQDRRTLNGALEKLKDRKIITFSKDDERFEITSVIRYVVNADFLKDMLDRYISLVEQTSSFTQEVSHD